MRLKQILTAVAFLPSLSLACDMSRSLAETQFVINPITQSSSMESIKNNSQIQIERCALETKYVLVNLNSLYFQDDTSRQESIGGNLIQKISNCSIKTEVPFQKMDVNILSTQVQKKNEFLRKCVKVVIADGRGQKIQIHPKSQCQFKPLNPEGTVVETDGAGCFVAVNPNSRLLMETRVNSECQDSLFLNQNQIQAGDYESVIKLWPARNEGDSMMLGSPLGARYVRHTLLPAKDFMPRAVKEYDQHPPFISALTTNISPGYISFMSLGQKRYQILPTFLVENIAKEYCKGTECARVSSFVTPIAGLVKISKINPKNNKKNQIGEWAHALKIPSNWSGLAEFKAENNMTGLSMGALEAEMTLEPGDQFEMQAQFYEPRTLLDEIQANQDYLDLNNNLNIPNEVDESLPQLPTAGKLGKIKSLPKMPSVGLGYKGILDLMDQLNMARSWTQKYDRLCNSQNMNCMKLDGMNKPFVTIQMKFTIGANKEIVPVSVSKKSAVFDSYEMNVTSFAKKVCE